jgi:hypothetical protein
MIRREAAKPGAAQSPEVNAAAQVLSYGTVAGTIADVAPTTALPIGSQLQVSLMAPWGEPLATTAITVDATNSAGPWKYSMRAPDYEKLSITVSLVGAAGFERSSTPPLSGASMTFDVKANQTSTINVELQRTGNTVGR